MPMPADNDAIAAAGRAMNDEASGKVIAVLEANKDKENIYCGPSTYI